MENHNDDSDNEAVETEPANNDAWYSSAADSFDGGSKSWDETLNSRKISLGNGGYKYA
ncbi:MAG: hypothetical protein WC805_01755 [Patescibacteria group bacterium]|jgi:hypothetical protein